MLIKWAYWCCNRFLFTMGDTFFDQIKLLMLICRNLGLFYNTDFNSRSVLSKIFNTLVRISLIILYIYSVYKYITFLYVDEKISQLVRIGDLIAIISIVSCLLSKWLYYYIKKKQLEGIILKVTRKL